MAMMAVAYTQCTRNLYAREETANKKRMFFFVAPCVWCLCAFKSQIADSKKKTKRLLSKICYEIGVLSFWVYNMTIARYLYLCVWSSLYAQ